MITTAGEWSSMSQTEKRLRLYLEKTKSDARWYGHRNRK